MTFDFQPDVEIENAVKLRELRKRVVRRLLTSSDATFAFEATAARVSVQKKSNGALPIDVNVVEYPQPGYSSIQETNRFRDRNLS